MPDDKTKFAVMIPGEETAYFDRYSDRIRVLSPDEYLVGYHRGPHEKIRSTFKRIRDMADGMLDEGCRLDDTEICIDIVDQFIEADKNNFVTKVMIKILRD
jgi:effector-binding domain-containing protein